MPYIGKQIEETELANRTVDTMIGDGADTTLTLSETPISVNNVLVFLDGIYQRPTTDYTLSGAVITFTTAPALSVKVVTITGGGEHIGIPLTPLTTERFMDSSVTDAKITGMASSKLTGALPALDGSALTGIPAISGIDTVSANDPTITTNPAAGLIWLNKTSGEMYICTDNTTNANVWTNVGEGTGNIS